MARGNSAVAARWLSRAQRFLPDDPTVRLLFASSLRDIAPHRCDLALDLLVEQHPWFRDARIARIAFDLGAGRRLEAAAGLDALLKRMAPKDDDSFRGLADAVVAAGNLAGWIGMSSAGRAMISAAAPEISLQLDAGRVRRIRRTRLNRSHPTTHLLPDDWQQACRLGASVAGAPLLGSGLALQPFRRADGFVESDGEGGLRGWATMRSDPDHPPALCLFAATATADRHIIKPGARQAVPQAEDLTAQPWTFQAGPEELPKGGLLHVIGPDGRDLWGSPIWLDGERQAARAAAAALATLHTAQPTPIRPRRALTPAPDRWRPLPVSLVDPAQVDRPQGRWTGEPPAGLQIDIVIPIYAGARDLADCLASLGAGLPPGTRIVLVEDGGQDLELIALAEESERRGLAILLQHERNRGFPAAANTGIRHAFADPQQPRDVLLLNPDTIAPPGFLQRLSRAAWSAADIGSATPLTGDGTVVSYPSMDLPNGGLTEAEVIRFDACCRDADAATVELPTAVGFCMYVRHDCLRATGVLREDVFAQGYGEENDWCLRARHLGWRHVAVPSVFVGHRGGGSFGAAKVRLMARNTAILNRLHPGYDGSVADFIRRDPLGAARAQIDLTRWRRAAAPQGSVVIVSHGKGGGVDRHVARRSAELRALGLRPIIITPAPLAAEAGHACQLSDGTDPGYPNLLYTIPDRLPALAGWLLADRPKWVEIHHLLGHAPGLAQLPALLAVPYDVIVHDYGQWCPRVTLVGRTGRYCGEPLDGAECEACVADLGARMSNAVPIADFRARSASLLAGARRVVVSCDDVGRRLARHFPNTSPTVIPWEDDAVLSVPRPSPGRAAGRHVIAVLGGIGLDKGYDVLLGCARDAARRDLSLEFVVVGHTMDDTRLLDTGRVFITGRYEEAEALDLLLAQRPAAGFVPSVCPETWCYALSTLWQAGLDVMAFDLGAQAERIARNGRGWLLPTGLPSARINDVLLKRVSRSDRDAKKDDD